MKKAIEFIKKNWIYILITLIGIVVSILTFKVEIDNRKLQLVFGKNKYLGFGILFIIGVIFSSFVYYLFNKKIKPEKVFLMIIIPIGLLYMFIIPIGRVPDENAHFYRTYEISTGRIISPKDKNKYGGDKLPKNIHDVFKSQSKYNSELKNVSIKASKKKRFIAFTNTALYSFITYLPQTIGVTIGRLLNLPIMWIAMLGRITNFIIWTLLMYYSIKLIPYKKLSLLIIMLIPMMLQEAASLSADALTNCSTFFFISYVLYLKYNKTKKITSKEKTILSLATIIMSVCKIVYLPLCLFVFLLPKQKFASKKRKYIEISILALLVIIINIFFFSQSIRYNAHVKTPDINRFNTSLQLSNIIHNPMQYTLTIYRTIYTYFGVYISQLLGESLCWYDVPISNLFIKMISIILIVISILDTSKIKNEDKICSALTIISIILLIFTSEYLTWTYVGETIISGVQGRYFLPLVIPLLILFNLKDLKYNLNKIYNYLFIIMIFINISVLATLFVAHIG